MQALREPMEQHREEDVRRWPRPNMAVAFYMRLHFLAYGRRTAKRIAPMATATHEKTFSTIVSGPTIGDFMSVVRLQ